MLHLRVDKVLKSCILLGILLTLILKTWLICYSAEEDGFHPSESPDSNYGVKIGTINIHLHGTEGLHALEENASSSNKGADNVVRAMNKPSVQSNSAGVLNTGGGTGRGNGTLPPSLGTTTHTIRTEDEKQTRTTGYVIGVSFWDQQTSSMANIMSLQCWAGHHDMVVTEPFMIDSKFGAPLTAEAMKHNDTMVRLGRLYDLDHWNEYSKKRGYAPMVEWKEFLHQAPRDVVIVKLNAHKSCSSEALILPYGFKAIKELCIKHTFHQTPTSMDTFLAQVFGDFSSSNVTVMFSDWSRSMINVFVDLNSVGCPVTHTHLDAISPSKEVNDSAEAYIENQFGGGEFNAVMLRLEWIVSSGSQEKAKEAVSSCLHKTVRRLEVMMNYTGVKSTFVAVDSGKYGSKTSYKLNSDFVLEQIQVFLKTVYGNSSSLQHWESTFEEISKSTSPGYIGYLQKVIATRAECVLLTGSSTGMFHKHALNMYKQLHRGTNDVCYATANMQCRVDASRGVALD